MRKILIQCLISMLYSHWLWFALLVGCRRGGVLSGVWGSNMLTIKQAAFSANFQNIECTKSRI